MNKSNDDSTGSRMSKRYSGTGWSNYDDNIDDWPRLDATSNDEKVMNY
jgi:hypothetical protein